MHLPKVLGEDAVRVGPGHGAELEHGLVGGGPGQPVIVHAAEVEELLAGDHEGGEVRRVDGQEDHGEHRPDVRHESAQAPSFKRPVSWTSARIGKIVGVDV